MSRKHNHKCVVMAIKIYILYIYIYIYLFDIAWHTCNLKNHSRAHIYIYIYMARPVISMQFDSQIIPFILDVF